MSDNFDMNQAIRDFFGTASTPDYAVERARYQEALMTELLSLLVAKEAISEAEAKGVIHRAKERVQKKSKAKA